jgi:NOL1/NOP2/sun family putative RNA methylase
MRALLGDEADAFLGAYEQESQAGLRVNTLKTTPQEVQQRLGWSFEPVPWCATGLYVPEGMRLGKHPYHAAGLYYLQEPSAMAVAEALDVQPGQHVLDLAAAPGGKATQIAALLQHRGLLVANEIDGGRVKALGENLERWGARNVVVANDTPERVADHFGAVFDRVLLDAPCSGEGMFRKNAAAQTEWSASHVQGCALRQERILNKAARLVKPGGRLVYSTCTFAPEENEKRIAAFLNAHKDWELVELPKQHGFQPARPAWAEPPLLELEHAVRLWPHRLRGEGHFIAALRRSSEQQSMPAPTIAQSTPRKRTPKQASTDSATLSAWHAFAQSTLKIIFPSELLQIVNDHLYCVPVEQLDLSNVRVVRPGLWLGTFKPGRFEPSHALALALHASDVETTVDVAVEEAERYLRGETLQRRGPSGWVLVTIEGWSLGWGRRTGDVVKNHYPKGLRWMG